MKKTFTFILTLFLTTAITICGFAEDVQKTECRDFPSFFDADELSRVLSDIRDDTFTKAVEETEQQNGQNSEVTAPYKRYNVTKDDFVYRLAAGEKITDMISSEYSWIIPGKNTVAQVDMDEKREWHMSEYATYEQEILDEGIVQKDIVDDNAVNTAIGKILNETSAGIEDVICIGQTAYFTDFVCVVTSDKTYLIPFGARPDFTGLANGTLYSPEAAAKILLQTTDQIVDADYKEEGFQVGGFRVKLRESKNSSLNLFIVIFPMVAAVAAAIPVVIVVQAKKHKSI